MTKEARLKIAFISFPGMNSDPDDLKPHFSRARIYAFESVAKMRGRGGRKRGRRWSEEMCESEKVEENKGVFLVTTTIAFVSFERDLSMNTDSSISTVSRGRERSE